MPAKKSDVKIIAVAYGKEFTLNCEEIPFGKFRIKKGRSLSKKMPYATTTEIADSLRRFIVKQQKLNNKFNYSGLANG